MTRYLKGGRKMLSARVDPSLVEAVDALGKRVDRNKSELVEEAIRLLLKRHGVKVKPGSENK